ncbi:helix-turn-helix domain-containing protein [Candidatus Margulisiibacteriota bacterium]
MLRKLAKRIKKIRANRKMSSEKLAYSIGLHKSTLNFIERCISDPKLSTLEQIAEGLDISLLELLDFDDELIDRKKQDY